MATRATNTKHGDAAQSTVLCGCELTLLREILSHLGTVRDLVAAEGVCRTWRMVSQAEDLWRALCVRMFPTAVALRSHGLLREVASSKQLARKQLEARWSLTEACCDQLTSATRTDHYSAVLTVTREDTKAVLYSGFVSVGIRAVPSLV